MNAPQSWGCTHCGAVSHHPTDAQYRYCGHCHHFCDDATLAIAEKIRGKPLDLPCPACKQYTLVVDIFTTTTDQLWPVLVCPCGFVARSAQPFT